MSTTIPFRLLICCSLAICCALLDVPAAAAYGDSYHTIIDHTQSNHLNVFVSNVQSTTSARNFPYIGASPLPWAAINPNLYPAGTSATKNNPDLYVQVKLSNSDVRASTNATTSTNNICDQSDPSKCPGSAVGVPQTFVHRLGYYNGSTVTPVNNSALNGGKETLNNKFTLAGQAFDVDRLRYVANRLWNQWKHDVTHNTGWASSYTYQPTGTMSFENFIYNVVHHHPMYGIVRVVIPTNACGDMYFDTTQATTGVAGNEFSSSFTHTWNGSGTSGHQCDASNPRYYQPQLWRYERKIDSTISSSSHSGTVTVYGMLMFDFVNYQTYDPDDFYDSKQDYVDRYDTVGAHDTATASLTSNTTIKNAIMARVNGRSIALQDWDTLNINPVDESSLRTAKNYVSTKSVSFQSSDITDAYAWEYWMRTAASDATQRTAIITDLTGLAPGAAQGATAATPQYNINTQAFASGANRRTGFNTAFASLPEQDQFHAYFPNGYERGWMIAFDALGMQSLDNTVTGTDHGLAGAWWKHLPDDDTANSLGGSHHADGGTNGRTTAYTEFGLPADNLAITVDANSDGNATRMPFFFDSDWEDLPALAFSGGLLDVHGFMNVSGMMYTPDSCEFECHRYSEIPGATSSAGAIQYVNGAVFVGKGVWLEDQDSRDHSMIAISYNYNAFNNLRTGTAAVTIMQVQNTAEIKN